MTITIRPDLVQPVKRGAITGLLSEESIGSTGATCVDTGFELSIAELNSTTYNLCQDMGGLKVPASDSVSRIAEPFADVYVKATVQQTCDHELVVAWLSCSITYQELLKECSGDEDKSHGGTLVVDDCVSYALEIETVASHHLGIVRQNVAQRFCNSTGSPASVEDLEQAINLFCSSTVGQEIPQNQVISLTEGGNANLTAWSLCSGTTGTYNLQQCRNPFYGITGDCSSELNSAGGWEDDGCIQYSINLI